MTSRTRRAKGPKAKHPAWPGLADPPFRGQQACRDARRGAVVTGRRGADHRGQRRTQRAGATRPLVADPKGGALLWPCARDWGACCEAEAGRGGRLRAMLAERRGCDYHLIRPTRGYSWR